MMKIIAILLSNLILIQSLNINLESFSKLNVLLEHAQFHQEKYGDNFFEFLYGHYGDKDVLDNSNHKEHKDLPFKKSTQSYNHHISAFSFKINVFELKDDIILNIKPNYFYKESFSFFEKRTIFQPPKYA
ncbi:hypothetical protein [Polaribacter sp. IC073]|uniref:hypothetical protein n=1 Tax=Polaribacter sp. IC073 TaxID=2508540 RepID=UPI0011BE77DA|nr:hypothetical protein [Polaribacter sp. IC073]TXD46856.1 hypothetical protein ES045_12865 [Polaribacter sp. IC073]